MLKRNSELRAQARQALEGKWGMAAVAILIYFVIVCVCSYTPVIEYVGWLACIPLGWGAAILFLNVVRGKNVELRTLFDGYYDFVRVFLTMLLMTVYTALWTLLLIIPGIIKSYSYAMTPYVLKDCPELTCNSAIEKSMAMMQGKKMKLFLLDLSFIGWAILSLLTLGIGFFLLQPYFYTARAAFYEDLKAQEVETGAVIGELEDKAAE